jgi:CSLREA domain-containing protein
LTPRTGLDRIGKAVPRKNGIWVLVAVAVAILMSPAAAFAQVHVVTTTEDDGDGVCDDTCSLRDAVDAVGGEPATIVLKGETYRLTRGQLDVGGTVSVEGVTARATTIDSNGEGRVATIAPGANATFSNLTVTDGNAAGLSDEQRLGGGFRVEAGAQLVLSRAAVASNFAAAAGGGISTAGVVQVIDSTISSNNTGDGSTPGGRGGGIHVAAGGHAVLVNATVSRNSAFQDGDGQPSHGGGVYSAGTFVMEHATIASNFANAGAGLYQAAPIDGEMALWNTLIAGNFGSACAGTVGFLDGDHNLADDASCELDQPGDLPSAFAGLLELDDYGGPTDTQLPALGSQAIDAAAQAHCPAADQRGVARPVDACDIGAVERRPQPVVTTFADGDDHSCASDDCTLREALEDSEREAVVLLEEGEYDVELGELVLRENRIIVGQGARRTILEGSGGHRVLAVADGSSLVSQLRITGGEADVGGGVHVGDDASLTLTDTAIQGNRATSGGGIATRGGLVVAASTVAANTAGERGGGILTTEQGSTVLVNSTVSGNTATGSGGGAATIGGSFGSFNATITANHAAAGGGIAGDAIQAIGDTRLINTIVAANDGTECAYGTDHFHVARASLSDDRTCFDEGNLNLPDTDPGLGPLDGSFGETDLHPLLDGSPAIGAGDDQSCQGTDQRGAARLRCDIGAFEGGTAATRLRLVTLVVDGPAQPSDFTVRVLADGAETAAAPGSAAGTSFTLDPGDYLVTSTGPANYRATFSGACDPDGDVSLVEGGQAVCTIALDEVTSGESCLEYPTFVQAPGLTLVGSAGLVGDMLQLNGPNGGVGAAWSAARVPLADGFTADYHFRIVPAGADGLAFVIQNHAADALGGGGGGIGYHEMPNSLAVEIDTFPNGFGSGDPNDVHVSVQSRGREPNSVFGDGQLVAPALVGNVQDGALHHVRVEYAPGRFDVFVDDLVNAKLSVPVDLAQLLALDGGGAYAGFTSATGAFVSTHEIGSWRLCSAGAPTGGGDVQNPSPPPPPPPPPPVNQEEQEELPPPEAGKEVNAVPKSGTIRVKVAGSNRFVELEEGQQIPVGSTVDTTKGRVTIEAAGGQTADFYDGVFRLTQGKGAKPLTTLTLVEALSCPKAGRAVAAAKKKKRRLWGDGDGKFQTKGKHSAATVVGTRWLVEDKCDQTLTRVVRGRVSVRDFVKKKTVIVRAGKKYVARAKR